MSKFTTLFFALALVVSAGCAHSRAQKQSRAYKTTYSVAAVTKTVIEEAAFLYEEEARERLNECHPQRNPTSWVRSKTDMDECMGPYNLDAQNAIMKGLAVYRTTAVALSAVMLGCSPPAVGTEFVKASCVKQVFSAKELRSWRGRIVEAATDGLREFPRADEHIQKLLSLVK